MLKIQEIREIIKLIDQSSIGSFSYETEGTKITLEKESGQQVASSTQTITVAQPVAVAAPAPVAAPVQAVVQAAPAAPVVEEVASGASEIAITVNDTKVSTDEVAQVADAQAELATTLNGIVSEFII